MFKKSKKIKLDSPPRRRTLNSFYEREDRREPDSVSDGWDNYDSLDPVIRRDSPYPGKILKKKNLKNFIV